MGITLTWDNLSPDCQKRNIHLKEILQGGQTVAEKEPKYRNKRVLIDGIWFDSVKESVKYGELKILKKAGEVIKIELQPSFTLQEGYRDGQTKRWVRPIIYVADFKVTYKDGRVEVIDTN